MFFCFFFYLFLKCCSFVSDQELTQSSRSPLVLPSARRLLVCADLRVYCIRVRTLWRLLRLCMKFHQAVCTQKPPRIIEDAASPAAGGGALRSFQIYRFANRRSDGSMGVSVCGEAACIICSSPDRNSRSLSPLKGY